VSREGRDREAMYQGKEGWRFKWTIVIATVLAVILLVVWARTVPWGPHLLEWLNLLVRWFHVVVGIGWIGSSFYFIWLENNLERDDPPEGMAGQLYSVHGGGFYYVQKFANAPKTLPSTLHWFQWEAYLTWVSGFCLLIIVYYANAQVTMVDVGGVQAPAALAILLGLATLAVGWLVYDRLCRSPLIHDTPRFTAVGFALVALLALGLSQLLSGRAAYMHVGAMLGTLMAANVFFVIIPAHRIMVQAAREGRQPDPAVGRHASLRSLHNNYLTLPVIFVMISSHFPSTFTHGYNWAILAGLFLASAAIRHYLNLYERGRNAPWILPAASLIVLALALVSAPQLGRGAVVDDTSEPVAFSEAQAIVTTHCAQCHTGAQAPLGVRLDSPEAIVRHAQAILRTAVQSDYMPLGNVTGMTTEERETLGRWIRQGAPRE
jgi:uncharacterized membrane protein